MKGLIFVLLLSSMMMSLSGCHGAVDTAATPSSVGETAQITQAEEPSAAETELTEPETEETVPETTAPVYVPEDGDFVRVRDYLPDVYQDLPYATSNNFTGKRIYGFTEVFLRYGTVKKLQTVCEMLAQQGLTLKIWDGFRPVSAQFRLWEIYPDDTFVADPTKGFSSHSRGNTVDITLVTMDGTELEMPTGFDDFSSKADRDYSDVPEVPAKNAMFLQTTMEDHGFTGYFGEWWHFRDTDAYPVEEVFEPVTASRYRAQCEEYINLRTEPDAASQSIARIPKDGEFTVLAYYDSFALAEYQGMMGYVNRNYIEAVS